MAQGSFYKRGKVWSVRYRDASGANRRKSGFRTKAEAQAWMDERHGLIRDGYRMDPRLTFRKVSELYLDQHTASDKRIEKLTYMLAKANEAFGDVALTDLEPLVIGAWRNTLSEGTRHDALAAVKQVLRAAVAWKMIPTRPAEGVSNPVPVTREFDPFAGWDDIAELEQVIRPHYRGLATIVTGTGLRPQEWTRLAREHVDLDRRIMVLSTAVVKPKTPARKVPLRGMVVDALLDWIDRNPGSRGLLFTDENGQAIDLRYFRRRVWYPAQDRVNDLRALEGLPEHPARRPYDMRHSYATWSLRAGLNTFALARRMGTSLEMIDKTYGHHATDSDAHELAMLDAFDRIGHGLGTSGSDSRVYESTDTCTYVPDGVRYDVDSVHVHV